MEAEKFLQNFFGTGNGIGLGRIPKDFDDWLQPWLDRVHQRRYPIVLPRLTAQHKMLWYAIASSGASGSELSELLMASVGRSYAEFSGRVAQLDSDDPIDQAVAAYLGTVVYKFTVPNRDDAPTVRLALDRLRNLVDSRPAEQLRIPRPVGRILRDFEFALISGNDLASQQLIDELRLNGHLSTANLAFLEVVRLGSVNDWDGIMAHPNLLRLVEMRRPRRVSAILVEAVYRHYFLASELENDVATAIRTMSSVVIPRLGALYQAAPVAGSYSIQSLLLVCLAAHGTPPPGARDLLSKVPSLEGEFTWKLANALRDRLPAETSPTQSAVELAKEAIANGQTALAVGVLAEAPPSAERAVLLLQCAYDLNTLQDAKMAIAALDALVDSSRAKLPKSRYFADLEASVRGILGTEGVQGSPTSWSDWFTRILDDPSSRVRALHWAQLGADEWDVKEFHDEAAIQLMASSLGTGSDEVVAIHRDALPYFLRGFATVAIPSIQPLRMRVLETLLYRGTHTRAELDVLLDVLDVAVPQMDAATYRQVLRDLTDVWLEVQSPAYMEWASQALDILVYQPCRDTSARIEFGVAVFASASAHQRRIQLPLRLTLNELGRELLIPADLLFSEPDGENQVADPLRALRGQRVAIYTLSESAGNRARDLLATWTKSPVEVLRDQVCTEELRVAARESDVFIMVTKSAKHAATDCIKVNRPDGTPLITTTGKGSSSIVYAVRLFLAGIGESDV